MDCCLDSPNCFFQLAKNYSIQVPIFKQYHKNIIGKGGVNIRKIREETNTQVAFILLKGSVVVVVVYSCIVGEALGSYVQ